MQQTARTYDGERHPHHEHQGSDPVLVTPCETPAGPQTMSPADKWATRSPSWWRDGIKEVAWPTAQGSKR